MPPTVILIRYYPLVFTNPSNTSLSHLTTSLGTRKHSTMSQISDPLYMSIITVSRLTTSHEIGKCRTLRSLS